MGWLDSNFIYKSGDTPKYNVKEHDTDKIIDELFLVMTELDARNCSSNSVIEKYQGTYWKELCDIGIKLLEVLKK